MPILIGILLAMGFVLDFNRGSVGDFILVRYITIVEVWHITSRGSGSVQKDYLSCVFLFPVYIGKLPILEFPKLCSDNCY